MRIECRVLELKPLGDTGGAGNLVICEALRMHIDDAILDSATGRIDPHKLPLVARLGDDWYCRVDAGSLFTVEKPNVRLGIGFDALPDSIRLSRILSGNDLGQLANVHALPAIDPAYHDERLQQIFQYYAVSPEEMEAELHSYARQLLQEGKVAAAWQGATGSQLIFLSTLSGYLYPGKGRLSPPECAVDSMRVAGQKNTNGNAPAVTAF